MNTDEEIEYLKQDYLDRMRLEFVNTIRMIQSEDEWKYLTQICETIRQSKENNFMYQY